MSTLVIVLEVFTLFFGDDSGGTGITAFWDVLFHAVLNVAGGGLFLFGFGRLGLFGEGLLD